jgi:DNA invertase Pin-like site-specific DNA recombinase
LASVGLLDAVLAAGGPRRVKWYTSAPPGCVKDVLELKRKFVAGELVGKFTATGLSKCISSEMRSRGFSVHPHTVLRWLSDPND